MNAWKRYWFAPAPYINLSVVRIIAVAVQLFSLHLYHSTMLKIEFHANLPDSMYEPLTILNVMNLPLGWGYRPSLEALDLVYQIAIMAGIFSLVGFLTNLSLIVFTSACVYIHSYLYSFGDFHHPEAAMMIALAALALSPSGRVLSVDSLLRRRLSSRSHGDDGGRRTTSPEGVLDRESPFAGWPLRLIQWLFVLMYLSAVVSKLSYSGLDWANGFTLQYYLIRDGLRWDSPLAVWLGQHHVLILLLQWFTLLFQATFALAVLFPKLRWIYIPLGLGFHSGIYLTLRATFFEWMALYAVFIPWATAFKMARDRLSAPAESASAKVG